MALPAGSLVPSGVGSVAAVAVATGRTTVGDKGIAVRVGVAGRRVGVAPVAVG